MKRLLSVILVMILISSVSSFAQSKKYIFCEIHPVGKFFKGGCTLRVNYGQVNNRVAPKKAQICDEKGNAIRFV